MRWVVGVYVTSPAGSEGPVMVVDEPLDDLSRAPSEDCLEARRRGCSPVRPAEDRCAPRLGEARGWRGWEDVDLLSVVVMEWSDELTLACRDLGPGRSKGRC